MATLYRAVSQAEYADILNSGRFRPSDASCEGKHFAVSKDDAERWGHRLFGTTGFVVVEAVVTDSSLANWYSWKKLDGIGPAYFADLEQLKDCDQIRISE